MNRILVSALIITYNQAAYIRECLEGAIKQEVDFDYEIVIGDDNSTDGTSEICREYAEKYPYLIKYYRREKNLGVKRNFLQTLKACQGNYIAICEGDDYWSDKKKVAIQSRAMIMYGDASLSYHQSTKIDNEGHCIGPLIDESFLRDYDRIELAKGRTWISTATMMFVNSKVFEENIPNDIINMDMVIVSLLGNVGYGKYISGINNSMYRIHAEGVWSQKTNSYKYVKFIKVFIFLKRYWATRDIDVAREFKRKIDRNRIKYINSLYKEEARIGFFRNGSRTAVILLLQLSNTVYILRLALSKLLFG